MTLQFRSRIKSAIDYSSDIANVGICCEHNTTPEYTGEEYTAYLSTANKCYSDQTSGSLITRTFYAGVTDVANFNCLKGSASGCCCSCLYARQSQKYNEFLNDTSLFPVDTIEGDKNKCDQYQYDLDIALHPEVGLKNNVPQCECGRIGGVWSENSCPLLQETLPTEDPDDDPYKYYNWFHDGTSWVSRPDTGQNSRTELIKNKCYKNDTLYFSSDQTDPEDPKGTCCLGPAINGDLSCYFELVTESACQILACDPDVTGEPNCVSSIWNDASGDAVECDKCWTDPVEGICCPDINDTTLQDSDFAQTGNPATQCGPIETGTGEVVITFDSSTGLYTRTSVGDINDDDTVGDTDTCPSGYNFIENGNCLNCTYKGQCCDNRTYTCKGWKTRNECIAAVGGNEANMNWISNSNCITCDYGPTCCNFPTGRCCIDEGTTITCNENYYKGQCDAAGGLWGGPNSTCNGTNPCGQGLCCNFNDNPTNDVPAGCNQGYTESSCCGTIGCSESTGLKFVETGDCQEECNFEKGICCSTLQNGTDKVCHGHITEQECNFIRNSGLYLETSWKNYHNDCVESGCSAIPRTLGVCCQDGAVPQTTGSSDGSYETCLLNINDTIQWTEVDCLYKNEDGQAVPYTNRQWNSAAQTCDICTSQTVGFCCDYANNTCTNTTQSQCCGSGGCIASPVDNDTGKYWSSSFTSCDQCNIKGRCCYVESENTLDPNIKTLRSRCKNDITKIDCIQNYKGFWDSTNSSCAGSNPCNWGLCCVTTNNIKTCYITTSSNCQGSFKPSAQSGWDYSSIESSWTGLGNGPAPIVCGIWNPETFTNPDNKTGISVSHINCVSGLHNCSTSMISPRECANCNFICPYSGAFCNFKDCTDLDCSPIEPTCQCFNGTYGQYLESYNNVKNNIDGSRICKTWYGNQSTNCVCGSCDICNASPGSYQLTVAPESINETPPNNKATFKLTGFNLNRTLGEQIFGYTLSAVTPNFSFNQDINTVASDSDVGSFRINPSTGVLEDTINFYSTDDSITEGSQIFKVETQVESNLLSKQCTIYDDSQAPVFTITFEGPHGPNWDQTLCEVCTQPPGFSYTNLILNTQNVDPGKTYYWGVTFDRFLGTDFQLNNKLLNLNNFIGITGTTGIATIDDNGRWVLGITLRNDFRSETNSSGDNVPIGFNICISDQVPYQTSSGIGVSECYGNEQSLSLRDDGSQPKIGLKIIDTINDVATYPRFSEYMIEGSNTWNQIQVTTQNVPPGSTWFYKIYGTNVSTTDFIKEDGSPFGLTGIITCNLSAELTEEGDYYLSIGRSSRFKAVSDAVETPDEGFTLGLWPGSNEYYYYQADGTTFYYLNVCTGLLAADRNPFDNSGNYPGPYNNPLYYPDNPWGIASTRPMSVYPEGLYVAIGFANWPTISGASDSCSDCMVGIVEQISFELGLSGSTGYSTSSQDYACEGRDYFLSLKTVNHPDGATFPFKILSPGITGAGLTGFAGTDTISPWQNGNGFTGMFTIYVPPGGNTGYDVCKFKVNYNLLTDETGSDPGKTFSVYLLPEVNRGITGVTSGVFNVYNCNQWQAQTPQIIVNTTPWNGTYSEIGEDPQYSLPTGVTYQIKTIGLDPFNTATTSYGGYITGTGASANNQLNLLITPAAGSTLTTADFDQVTVNFYNYQNNIVTRNYTASDLRFSPNIFGITYPVSMSPGSAVEQGGITLDVFFKIKDDKFKDRDPCSGVTSENFTIEIAPGQYIDRNFAPTDYLIPTNSKAVRIIENSLPASDFTIYGFKFNNGVYTQAIGDSNVPEGTQLEFRLFAKNVCLGNTYFAKIEGVNGFTIDDIDFTAWTNITSQNFGPSPQTKFYFTMGDGTYETGRTSSNSIRIKIKDDAEVDLNGNDEGIKISSYLTDTSSFSNYSIIIRVEDLGDPTPRGRCCDLDTTPYCRENVKEEDCLGIWNEDNKCPTRDQCVASTPVLGNVEVVEPTFPSSGKVSPGSLYTGMNPYGDDALFQTYDISIESCSECCGYEEIFCCLPNTGNIIKVCKRREDGTAQQLCGLYGGSPVDSEQSPCTQQVTCCDDFTNTCSVVDIDACVGLFKRQVEGSQDSTCAVCDFETDDPACTAPDELKNVQWTLPSPTAWDNWATVVDPVITNPILASNVLEYACRMDICCKGDGTGCSKVVWNYNTNGTRVLASGYTCSSANGDVLLSEEFKNINNNQYISKCLQYGARTTSRWQQASGENLEFDYQNLIQPNVPYKGEDCYFDAYGVCCKLNLQASDDISCAGSRTSRTWCFNKNTGSNQHRWLSSKYECSNVFVKTPTDTSPVQINLGKYDCDICEKLNILDTPATSSDLVKEEKYFYPGYFKDGSGITRDRNPGTLPGSVVMHSCNNCLKSTIDYPVYRDYFKNLPAGTAVANKFAGSNNAFYSNLQYYSDKDTFRQTLNPNNTQFTEQQCCTTPSDQYQVRSNFLIPSATPTQVIPCTVCSNAICTCNYGNPITCPTFDFSDCEDGSSQDPYGRCCINGSCSIKVKRDCELQGGLWGGANTTCANINGGPPCDLGACCNGDVDAGGTCTNNVIRANCSVANFNQGKQCGVIQNGILTCASEPRVTCCYSNYNGSSTGTCLQNIRQSLCPSNSCDTSNGTLPKGTAVCDSSLCSDMDIGKCCTSGTCAVKTRKCCVDGGGTFTLGGNCDGSNPCNVTQLGRCCYRTVSGNPSRCRPCSGNEQEINPVAACCQCLDGKTKAQCDDLVGSDSSALDADGNSAWNINQTCTTNPCPVCEKRKKCTACQSVYQAENSGTINLIPNMGSSQTTFQVQQNDVYNIVWKVVSHDSSCTTCNTNIELSASINNICWKDNTTVGNFAPNQITIPATPQSITLTRLDQTVTKCCNIKCRPNCGDCEVKYFSGPIVSNAGIVTSGGCGDTSLWNQVGNPNGGSAIYLTTTTNPQLARSNLAT